MGSEEALIRVADAAKKAESRQRFTKNCFSPLFPACFSNAAGRSVMVPESKLSALRLNYAAFMRRLPELLPDHEGQYALMRDGNIVEYFNSPREALLAGRK